MSKYRGIFFIIQFRRPGWFYIDTLGQPECFQFIANCCWLRLRLRLRDTRTHKARLILQATRIMSWSLIINSDLIRFTEDTCMWMFVYVVCVRAKWIVELSSDMFAVCTHLLTNCLHIANCLCILAMCLHVFAICLCRLATWLYVLATCLHVFDSCLYTDLLIGCTCSPRVSTYLMLVCIQTCYLVVRAR